jgi:outer membrane protein assembly factor BamB
MKRLLVLSIVLSSLTATQVLAAEPVTFFRADLGLANNDARPLPEQLDSAAVVVWREPLAPGHSSPCVCGNRIFLTTFEDKKLATVALDRTTGKVLWQVPAPAERIEEFHPTGSAATSTPACDGERVYVFFGSYGLLCYDLEGKLLWSKPMGPFQDEFGSGSSPILVDGKLILNEDHDINSFLMAIDAKSGETVWKTPREGFTRSYSTPVVWTAGDKRQLVVAGALQLAGYDLQTGRQLWSQDGLARIVNTTPTQADGLLFVATWSPGGDSDSRLAMDPWPKAISQWDKNNDGKLSREEVNSPEVLDRFYRIDLNQDKGLDEAEWKKYARVFELAQNSVMALKQGDKESDFKPTVVWEYRRGVPYVSSPLVYRGVVYMAKDGGIATSLDAHTGKVLKQARLRGNDKYYASPVAGDGKVYLVSEAGVISVLKAQGNWEILSSHDLAERTVATPILADGKIYLRTEKAMYCFGTR